MNSIDQPLVSIVCESYNHGPFLRQCLQGFVSQKTDFPFEILIHDDASTDNSADIIREFEAAYPALFKPIYQVENQYSKGVHIWARIQFPRAKGKYIALCEGDDYWTDPLKLQKQVDYMESHPEISLTFGNAVVHFENGNHPDHPYLYHKEMQVYSGEEYLTWHRLMPTATMLFRKTVVESPIYQSTTTNPRIVVGDLPLVLACAEFGDFFAFPDFFAVYRRHGDSFSSGIDSTRRLKIGRMWEEVPRLFGSKYNEASVFQAVYHYRFGLPAATQEGNPSNRRKLLWGIIKVYCTHPLSGIKRLSRILRERKSGAATA